MIKKIIYILVLSMGFSLMPFSVIADNNKIVKWKDSNGVTHYGDKLPAQEAGRSNVEMRNNGVVIKQNIQLDQTTDRLYQQKQQQNLAQQRADKVLLASYTNAEEIDLACERNLQMDHAAIQSLIQHKEIVFNRTARNHKAAQQFKQKNKPLPAYLNQVLKQYQLEINAANKQIAQRKLNMQTTRKRYAEEKARFITLKQLSLEQLRPEQSSLEQASLEQASKTASEPAMATSLNMR